jgi:integrase/recombinase XerD
MQGYQKQIHYFVEQKTIVVQLVEHHSGARIALYFKNTAELNSLVRAIPGARWSRTLKAWHIADVETHRIMCKVLSIDRNTNAIKNNRKINTETRELLNKYTNWMEVKRHSKSTIESYTNALPVFFSDYHTKHADEITNKDVMDFNTHYILKKNLSATYQSQFINALKLFYQTVKDHKLAIDQLIRPQQGHKLPKVINVRSCCADK